MAAPGRNRYELDLLDDSSVSKWMKANQPDVVVLAAAVGGIVLTPVVQQISLENLKIELHVIEAAWKAGVRRLLFLGSSCIYPKYAEQPIEESLLTGSLEPTNEWYAIAKIAGIKLCQALRRQHKFDAQANAYQPIRASDNYHPTNSHVLPALIRRFQKQEERSATVTCWGTGKLCEVPPRR